MATIGNIATGAFGYSTKQAVAASPAPALIPIKSGEASGLRMTP
ncbi:MAG: hypothetical protein WLagBPW_40370 [Shewanella algae]